MDVSSLSCHQKCQREEVQRVAMKEIPHERPRPGRRRLSMRRPPLSLTQIFFFATMILSVLCRPTEAVQDPGSQSRAVEGHFVDGRITFDQDSVPQPELQRRQDSATTTTLPRAFDSGFGTNYTQPSCPTFLRSMVNNETFVSCVPFSLLLQVRLFPRKNPFLLLQPCHEDTDLVASRTPCPSSTPAAPSPPSPPS